MHSGAGRRAEPWAISSHSLSCRSVIPSARCRSSRDAGWTSLLVDSRVVEFMSRHFAEPLTLDRLASEACISRYHFARLFKAKVGQSPHRYLAGIRLDAARRMLETTDHSVATVGAACGYPASSPLRGVVHGALRRLAARLPRRPREGVTEGEP